MIRNINDCFGDRVEFDDIREFADCILLSGYELPEEGLKEGIDYEYTDNTENDSSSSRIYRLVNGQGIDNDGRLYVMLYANNNPLCWHRI